MKWFEAEISSFLDKHTKITRVTSYSKRWWNDEVAQARKAWAKEKKRLGNTGNNVEELKKARNAYYRVIRKAKRVTWQRFLQGEDREDILQDKNRCWTAFKYTKPLQFKTTPALKDGNGNTATSMKAKEALVCKTTFPSPPISPAKNLDIAPGRAHISVTKEQVHYSLMAQSAIKAPGPDKINFKILRMMWEWESDCITSMVQQAVRLGHHPEEWKRARGILLEKGGKRDFTLVKSYRVISLLNCMGKVLEKVIAEQLSQFCESFCKLHMGQMGARKERCAIDAVALLVQRVEEIWAEKKLAAALFMDVKGAFDHVARNQLISRMVELDIDGDLIRWTRSFLTDRKIQLIIDGHANQEERIETGIPQGSPVSPILFLIYISGVFGQVGENLPGVVSLSFVDDLGFIASGASVKEIAKTLEKVSKVVLQWGKENAVTYDTGKTELVLFSKARPRRRNRQLRETTVLIAGEHIKFNKEATRWLGVWLDGQL